MGIIYLLLSISIFIALGFLIAFIVTVKKGQYDDVYTPSVRMLFDDEIVVKKPESEIENNPTEIKNNTCKPWN